MRKVSFRELFKLVPLVLGLVPHAHHALVFVLTYQVLTFMFVLFIERVVVRQQLEVHSTPLASLEHLSPVAVEDASVFLQSVLILQKVVLSDKLVLQTLLLL